MTAIPLREIHMLTTTVLSAVDLARAGRLADGYESLVAELRRVEGLEEPWVVELRARWRLAVERYCAEYGVREE